MSNLISIGPSHHTRPMGIQCFIMALPIYTAMQNDIKKNVMIIMYHKSESSPYLGLLSIIRTPRGVKEFWDESTHRCSRPPPMSRLYCLRWGFHSSLQLIRSQESKLIMLHRWHILLAVCITEKVDNDRPMYYFYANTYSILYTFWST